MLPALDADLGPGVRALFTSRASASSGERTELNLGLNVDDDPNRVLANLELVAREVGAPLALARQVHGADVHVVTRPPSAGSAIVATADALVTTSPDVALGVVVADCVPVLLADVERRIVATAHAGRGGLVAGIVPAALDVMRSLGARDVHAVVGPAVCGQCYEVPEGMRDEVDAVVPGTATTTSWGTPALDLPAGVLEQLRVGGVGRVVHVRACTFTDERFYSHRRWTADGTRRGRFAGVVRLAPRP